MASPRRLGAPEAKNRKVLLDAAEQLMMEEGYAAVSSRRVADRAGLKPQLFFYYFRSMDELFLSILRRRIDEGSEYQSKMLNSDHPLHTLWEFNADPRNVRLTMEFIGLSYHRPAVRSEVARFAERLRTLQTDVIDTFMRDNGFDTQRYPPAAVAVLMASLSRVVVMEQALGVSGGHAEALEMAARELDRLDRGRKEQ